MASLTTIPNDILIDIITRLDTARDASHLSQVSRHTHTFFAQEGWKAFVRSSFPSLAHPLSSKRNNAKREPRKSWNAAAERLTYLDRCWDRRSLYVTLFREDNKRKHNQCRKQPGSQSVSLTSVVNARLFESSQDELLVWGAGENLLLRTRSGKDGKDRWQGLDGIENGYWAGTGDITAVSLLERSRQPEMIVGRANGDLQLLSADMKNFGASTQKIVPMEEDGMVNLSLSSKKLSPGHVAVTWTEWNKQSNVLASARSSNLTLYDLSNTTDELIKPTTRYSMIQSDVPDETCLIRGVKFMGSDRIACALGGSREPLRLGKITPTGVAMESVKMPQWVLDEVNHADWVQRGNQNTVRAIEAVGPANLLLSAWNDGSVRLTDVRTPSGADNIYRDRFFPFDASGSLLSYGTERFVAGSNTGPNLHFFDFRWPKSYYHTSPMSCSATSPEPSRMYGLPKNSTEKTEETTCEECVPKDGLMCSWHAASRRDSWRPDGILFLAHPAFDRVPSLTKASDTATSFYCGMRGGIAEAEWLMANQESTDNAPSLRKRPAPKGWRAGAVAQGKMSLIETGVGSFKFSDSRTTSHGVPKLFRHQMYRGSRNMDPRRRLDPEYIIE